MRNNKLYIKATAFVLTISIAIGCNVLEQEPETLIPTSTSIVDLQSAEAAVNGLYNDLQDGDLYGGRFIMATEMAAGNGRAAAFQQYWKELETGIVPTSNFHIQDNWSGFYAVVNTANSILDKVPALNDVGEADERRMLGTAYFMRGLAFFDLLRQYGEFFNTSSAYGVPLPLEPSVDVKETPRATVSESFQRVQADLESAIQLLDDGSDKFYVSRGAAQALKARVHLYQQEFDEAEQLASLVISNSAYTLSDDYNELYASEGSSESIFELNFINLDDPNSWATEMYISPPEVTVNDDLVSFFNNRGESERALNIQQIGDFIRCTKYGSQPADEGSNTILLRLSEMYLIRAEALALRAGGSLTDALPDINRVRSRAGLPDLTAANVSSQSALIDVLLSERRAEFAWEGHYWFDLVRFDRLSSTRGLESFRKIFPIPQREINITDGTLIQNPNY